MARTFRLERFNTDSRPVPSQCEDLGIALMHEAQRMNREHQERDGYIRDRIATLFELAADAFDMGASASLGHNRRDRYLERSRMLLEEARKLRNVDQS